MGRILENPDSRYVTVTAVHYKIQDLIKGEGSHIWKQLTRQNKTETERERGKEREREREKKER